MTNLFQLCKACEEGNKKTLGVLVFEEIQMKLSSKQEYSYLSDQWSSVLYVQCGIDDIDGWSTSVLGMARVRYSMSIQLTADYFYFAVQYSKYYLDCPPNLFSVASLQECEMTQRTVSYISSRTVNKTVTKETKRE